MLVILEATAGPVTGRKIEIRAGSILRIGRTPKSDYAIGEDSYLSSLHFAVECDGAQCRVRDLGSSNGTFVNGERVTEILVREGDSVMAGGSTFAIHVDASAGAAPTPSARTSTVPTATFTNTMKRSDLMGPLITGEVRLEWPGFSRSQSSLLNTLYKDDLHVHAVLDASRDSRIPASRTPLSTGKGKFPRISSPCRANRACSMF
jgi:pSer/pThr/pTyr-binding forkhead associated (FHA) protein